MEELLAIALVGTAKNSSSLAEGGSVEFDLVSQLPGLSTERRLLLQAGVASVLEFSGAPTSTAKRNVFAAPPEEMRTVSPRAAAMLAELMQGGAHDVLLEACRLLREHEQVLAPELLPEALASTDIALQTALPPVLGQRGRWLSQFDKSWQWATATLAADDKASERDLESQWSEGTLLARRAALDRVRRTNPEQARTWLREAWPREKAETRLQLLQTMAGSLSIDDVEFLESVASDRSMPVRVLASELLCKLDGSSLATKVREWCDSYLTRTEPKKSLTAKLQRLAGVGAGLGLSVTPPQEFDPAWRELGIADKPPANMGQRAYWLVELVRRVHPAHWQQKFAAMPRDLLAAVASDDFGPDVILAWSEAATLFLASDWAEALWHYWLAYDPPKNDDQGKRRRYELLPKLLGAQTSPRAEQLLIEGFGNLHTSGAAFHELVDVLPKPWSARFGAAYLKLMRASLAESSDHTNRAARAESLLSAAVALPAECFADVLSDWTLPETDDYFTRYFIGQWNKFQETIRTRARLHELIAAG